MAGNAIGMGEQNQGERDKFENEEMAKPDSIWQV